MARRLKQTEPDWASDSTLPDSDDPLNEPEDIAGKSPGAKISRIEAQARRAAIDLMLMDGHPDRDIVDTLGDEFNTTKQHAKDLLKTAKARFQSHCDDRKPLNRALTERRVHQHIAAARKRNQFAAVAQLERQLAAVQGTEVTPEVTVNLNARLTQAVIHVLGDMEPAQIQSVIVAEAARLPVAK